MDPATQDAINRIMATSSAEMRGWADFAEEGRFFIEHYRAFETLVFIFWILIAITAIHCAHKGPEKGRTAWVICIAAFPIVGAAAYWFLTRENEDAYFPEITQPRPASPVTAPTKAEAALAESVREALARGKR